MLNMNLGWIGYTKGVRRGMMMMMDAGQDVIYSLGDASSPFRLRASSPPHPLGRITMSTKE